MEFGCVQGHFVHDVGNAVFADPMQGKFAVRGLGVFLCGPDQLVRFLPTDDLGFGEFHRAMMLEGWDMRLSQAGFTGPMGSGRKSKRPSPKLSVGLP